MQRQEGLLRAAGVAQRQRIEGRDPGESSRWGQQRLQPYARTSRTGFVIWDVKSEDMHRWLSYIKFSEDPTATYHYVFDCPGFVLDGEADYVGEKFPQPKFWYYCTSKQWKCRYSDAEFAAFWASMGASGADASTTAADAMDGTEP